MPSHSLEELARWVGGTLIGTSTAPVTGVAGLEEAGPSDVSFLANPKYRARLDATRAGAVIVGRDVADAPVPMIQVDQPDAAFARIAERFAPPVLRPTPGVHPTAVIDPTAILGRDVSIGPFCVVGPGARIGDRTVCAAHVCIGAESVVGSEALLHPRVVVRERVRIGDRVVCHAGSVIGSDGFGFAEDDGIRVKIPQIGTVEIGDDVSIGANTTIDRARFGVTRIGRGTKIDNQVQVGHNVELGEHSVICAQVGIAGSTRLGRNVLVGGQAGFGGHLTIGDTARIAGRAGVTRSVPAGETWSGFPAREHVRVMRETAAATRLPDLIHELRELRTLVNELRKEPNARIPSPENDPRSR